MWWGDPHVRLPSGGVIPVCGTGSGYVIFRWKDPQGVFQIPSDRCPGVGRDLPARLLPHSRPPVGRHVRGRSPDDGSNRTCGVQDP